MGDVENLINNPAGPGTPAPGGEPATPDQGTPGTPQGAAPEGAPEGAEGGQAADQQPGGQAKTGPGDKYKELISGMGENVINEMIQKYEKVEELLGSPESLKDLSKEEIVQLYQLRDNLQKNLSEILPALQERTKTQMDSHLEGIEEPEIKEYVAGLKEELDEPEEMEALVQVVKDVVAIMKGKQGQGGQPGGVPPANLKGTMGGGQEGQAPSLDFEKAMLSPDPKVRAEAMKAFDAQLANRQAQEKQR